MYHGLDCEGLSPSLVRPYRRKTVVPLLDYYAVDVSNGIARAYHRSSLSIVGIAFLQCAYTKTSRWHRSLKPKGGISNSPTYKPSSAPPGIIYFQIVILLGSEPYARLQTINIFYKPRQRTHGRQPLTEVHPAKHLPPT